MRKLMVVVGTRPNYMKVSRFREVAQQLGGFHVHLVHTGQHREPGMTRVFHEELGLHPDVELGVDDGPPAVRMAHMMLALHQELQRAKPHAMVVVGDVDSTLAAALVAHKAHLPLVHVEAGLRNGDRTMPEEINRLLTDRVATHGMVTEPSGVQNLRHEGMPEEGIHLVGNTMIDTLVAQQGRIAADPVLEQMGLGRGGHVLFTMHRPANVDRREGLHILLELLNVVAQRHRVVFPVHPRTARQLEGEGLWQQVKGMRNVHPSGPLGYWSFQRLLATSLAVVTDSGGVQEETTFLGIPCLTLRPSTERPITVEVGTNELLPPEPALLQAALERIAAGNFKKGRVPELWDGRATERIFAVLQRVL